MSVPDPRPLWDNRPIDDLAEDELRVAFGEAISRIQELESGEAETQDRLRGIICELEDMA